MVHGFIVIYTTTRQIVPQLVIQVGSSTSFARALKKNIGLKVGANVIHFRFNPFNIVMPTN